MGSGQNPATGQLCDNPGGMSRTFRTIAPSILLPISPAWAKKGATSSPLAPTGSTFDVMDNHYALPNLTFGPMVCQALKPHAKKPDGAPVPIDVHLMIQPVDALAAAFADAGADYISFHPMSSGPRAPQHPGHPSRGRRSLVWCSTRPSRWMCWTG